MDALLFAFLLTVLLDQGDRPQHLALAFSRRHGLAQATLANTDDTADPPGPSWTTLLVIGAVVIVTSILLAAAGVWIGGYLPPRPRLLFLALAILIGASGFLLPQKAGSIQTGLLGSAPVMAGRLLLARLNGRAGFGLLGYATYSGDPTGVAAGGILAGLLTSMMAVVAGPAYLALLGRPLVRLVMGGALLLVALPLALTALGLV